MRLRTALDWTAKEETGDFLNLCSILKNYLNLCSLFKNVNLCSILKTIGICAQFLKLSEFVLIISSFPKHTLFSVHYWTVSLLLRSQEARVNKKHSKKLLGGNFSNILSHLSPKISMIFINYARSTLTLFLKPFLLPFICFLKIKNSNFTVTSKLSGISEVGY